jgi:sporulation protein YlmC with PRC-barrel domain
MTNSTITMADPTSITTGSLVSAKKVEGTTVYNLAGEKVGTVNDIMIDKVSGRAIYAVMSFGGFLGMGEKFHPIPWSTLKYDQQKGGYVVNIDKKLLLDAPAYDAQSEFKWTPDYGRKVDSYYGSPSYWY